MIQKMAITSPIPVFEGLISVLEMIVNPLSPGGTYMVHKKPICLSIAGLLRVKVY